MLTNASSYQLAAYIIYGSHIGPCGVKTFISKDPLWIWLPKIVRFDWHFFGFKSKSVPHWFTCHAYGHSRQVSLIPTPTLSTPYVMSFSYQFSRDILQRTKIRLLMIHVYGSTWMFPCLSQIDPHVYTLALAKVVLVVSLVKAKTKTVAQEWENLMMLISLRNESHWRGNSFTHI